MEHSVPVLLVVGLIVLLSFYLGKSMKWVKLPSIIGFMVIGVAMGNMIEYGVFDSFHISISHHFFNSLSFITDVALAFVAIIIGLELSFSSLKKQGSGIVAIIFAESFTAFFTVTILVYLLTKKLPLALIFGAIAPASAPAGTVAIIQEYKARGPLTKALYAVVGFDDGLGIIIFGFAAAFARMMIESGAGGETTSIFVAMLGPLKEVILSLTVGILAGLLFCVLGRKLNNARERFILIFGFALITSGLSSLLHLSLILTNMIMGMLIVNTQPRGFVEQVGEGLENIMPLLYVLFFTLAGANLHLGALPSLGILGVVYVIGRSAGLIGGAKIGSSIGTVHENIKKYLGLGILSQAGVAIGLSLMVKQDFSGVGKVVEGAGESAVTVGDQIGTTVITTVTATCIFFEIIGPILTKIALTKAGEINKV